MSLMPRKVCACGGNRVSRLIREGVQRNEAIDLYPVILSQTEAVRLHLTHGLIADLLCRLCLVGCLRFEIKEAELTVELYQRIEGASASVITLMLQDRGHKKKSKSTFKAPL